MIPYFHLLKIYFHAISDKILLFHHIHHPAINRVDLCSINFFTEDNVFFKLDSNAAWFFNVQILDEHDQTALQQPVVHQKRTSQESRSFIVLYQDSITNVYCAVFVICLKKQLRLYMKVLGAFIRSVVLLELYVQN